MAAQVFSARNMPSANELEGIFQGFPFEDHYRKYYWKGKFHKKPDQYPAFCWISAIEDKAAKELSAQGYLSKNTVIEIFEWGTGKRPRSLNKAKSAKADYWKRQTRAAYKAILKCPTPFRLLNRESVEDWIKEAYLALTLDKNGRKLEYVGLTYYSKILRFMLPKRFGAYDVDRLDRFLKNEVELDAKGNTLRLSCSRGERESEAKGYAHFCWMLQVLADYLNRNKSSKRKWRAADVEMAFFSKSSSKQKC